MELLIAFLIAFGVINADDTKQFKSNSDLEALVSKNNLDKDFIIWEAEGDDF